MTRKLLLLVAVCFFVITSNAFGDPVGECNKQLDKLKPVPDQISAALNSIEKEGMVTEKNSINFIDKLDKYAVDMKKAFEQVGNLTLQEAKSEGKENQGASKSLSKFEEMATAHEKKMKELDQKAQKIDDMVKSGKIRIDPALIKRMSQEERKDLMEFLDEPARKEYKQKYPELFASLVNHVADLLSSPAEASQAAVCLPLCNPATWPVGAACVALMVGVSAAYQWNTFQSAYNWCGTRSRWVRYACRTAAVLVYVAYVA